jgi:arylsulfatase A-like enzyme
MSTTGPSHASLFTGLQPRQHGVVKNGLALDPSFQTLAEDLKAEDYETAAFVSSFPLNERFGLSQGFDHYYDLFANARSTMKVSVWEGIPVHQAFDRRADDVTSATLQWFEQAPSDHPWFVWVHYFDPHYPYDPPEPFRSRFATDPTHVGLYDGELAFVDAQVGRLLSKLGESGRLAQTVIIVVGDHGEGLMDHGHMEHGLHLYEEAVRVPLIVASPAGEHGIVEGPRAIVNLKAAILGPNGIRVPGDFGRDEDPIYLQRRHYEAAAGSARAAKGPTLGLRQGHWKWIEAPQEGTRELYDLAADPKEMQNLATSDPERSAHMQADLERWAAQTGLLGAAPGAVSPSDQEGLRALGYVQ